MSSPKTPASSIEALFAEAIEAVESIEKKTDGVEIELVKEAPENSESTEAELDIELDLSDFDESPAEETAQESTELQIEGDSDALLEELEAAKLRIFDLEGEQSAQEAQLTKAKKIILKRKAESERLKSKLEFTQKELIQHRMLLQNAQTKIEMISRRLSDAEVARDQSSSRVMQLQAAHDQSQEKLNKEQLLRGKENEEHRRFGGLKIMRSLLPALDNLQLSLKHQEGNIESFASAIGMVEKQMLSILSNLGLNSIEANPEQEFDPNIHEAMLSVPSNSHKPNTIVEVIRSGYMLHERLVRAARVSVAVAIDEPSNSKQSEPDQAPLSTEADEVDDKTNESGPNQETEPSRDETISENAKTEPEPSEDTNQTEMINPSNETDTMTEVKAEKTPQKQIEPDNDSEE